ncbi:hypothetical protein RRG08_033168 [Elysia crispata]|uniref:Uncharacterized protein n=1 Tax=Elysia crispata TaxID=231223 RepID=A0AAE1D755_9GAST|nr:hypothetical protein RRG08_033168 [Elysia crispata]
MATNSSGPGSRKPLVIGELLWEMITPRVGWLSGLGRCLGDHSALLDTESDCVYSMWRGRIESHLLSSSIPQGDIFDEL